MIDRDVRLRQMETSRYATLRDWAAVGFRRRRLIATSFCGLLVGTILFSVFWAARYYESDMQIFVAQDRTDPQVSSAPSAAVQSNQAITPDVMNSEMALLQAPDILRQVVVNCGLEKKSSLTDFLLPSDPARRTAIKVEKQAAILAKKINVEVLKQADVIDVTYGRVGAPEVPACVLSNLSVLYMQKHVETHRPTGSSTVFASEVEKYHTALMSAEQQLKDFGTSEGVVAPDVERTLVATQLVNTQGLLNTAKAAAAADQHRITEVEGQLKSMPARRETIDTDQDAGILLQQLDAALLTAQMKRSQLAMKYSADYPLVKEADEEVAEAQAAIADAKRNHILSRTTDQDTTYELLRQDLAKTKADLATQQASAASLEQSMHDMQSQTVSLDQKAIKQQDLLREAKANEDNYLLYLAKREQERSSDAMDRSRVANVSVAVPPVVPVLPAHNPFMIFLLGLIFSIFVSLSVAFIAEYFDPSFQTPAEVNGVLRVPVLASIPRQAA
jgi:polysaccharide biosynthesis protein PslE